MRAPGLHHYRPFEVTPPDGHELADLDWMGISWDLAIGATPTKPMEIVQYILVPGMILHRREPLTSSTWRKRPVNPPKSLELVARKTPSMNLMAGAQMDTDDMLRRGFRWAQKPFTFLVDPEDHFDMDVTLKHRFPELAHKTYRETRVTLGDAVAVYGMLPAYNAALEERRKRQ